MQTHFNASFFTANRRALRERLNTSAPIVLAAHGILQRNGDSAYPFQQDSNFWYLTGLEDPDLVLIMTVSGDYLIVPARNAVRQIFDGETDTAALTTQSGISSIENERTGWRRLQQEVATKLETYVCGATALYDSGHGLWANPATHRLHRKLKRSYRDIKLFPIDSHLAALRVIKQPDELAAIQSAIDVTTETINSVSSQLQSFTHEYELEAAISQGFRSRGASGHGFSPIVANGSHATILHNVANSGVLKSDALTVLDIGAEVDHYSADITRTLVVGLPSLRQHAVYQAVLEVQDYALSLLKPNTLPYEYEKDVALFMGKQLRQLGLINRVDYASVRRYYPHSTSHFLGLDVHDVGNYREPLQTGMVLTCEPGIYIPEEGIGVRIEDDVLITSTGNQVLSAACPRVLRTVQ
jgi:Xaa-Pro aminopeptidase